MGSSTPRPPDNNIFRQIAQARGESWGTDRPRFHLREKVSRADEEFAAQIADASAPFWRHVRDALAERAETG